MTPRDVQGGWRNTSSSILLGQSKLGIGMLTGKDIDNKRRIEVFQKTVLEAFSIIGDSKKDNSGS